MESLDPANLADVNKNFNKPAYYERLSCWRNQHHRAHFPSISGLVRLSAAMGERAGPMRQRRRQDLFRRPVRLQKPDGLTGGFLAPGLNPHALCSAKAASSAFLRLQIQRAPRSSRFCQVTVRR